MLMTMMSSISVSQGIEKITGTRPMIKWPNDLLLNGKKVCGILTELDAEIDLIKYSVVGIGINVNNELERDLEDIATTLKRESGEKVSRVELLRSILRSMDTNYEMLKRGDHEEIRERWTELSNIKGRRILVKGERETLEGTVIDVDESGCIILDTEKGQKRIVSGDVQYLT